MIQLYLNEQLADVSQDETVALSYQLNNIAELSNRNGNFSNRITLPLSKTNQRIIEDTNIVTSEGSTPYRVLDCRVYKNGIEVIKKGRAVIQQINTYDFEINIFSGLSNFFELIEGLSLQDLDFSDFDHIYNLPTIVATSRNTYDLSAFAYPVIDYGLLPETGVEVNALQLYPSVFYRSILEKIVETQGYTVTGDILEDDIFLRTVSAFSNKEFKNGKRFEDDNNLRAEQTAPESFADNGSLSLFFMSFFGYTGVNTIQPRLKITFDVTVSTIASPSQIGINVYKNGLLETSLGFFRAIGSYEFTSDNFVINPSDLIQVGIVGVTAYNVTIENAVVTFEDLDLSILNGSIVNLEATLPELTQEEWLISVFNQFGIIPISDNDTRILQLLTYRDIYNNKSIGLDWSKKIDIRAFEKETKIGGYAQNNALNYKSDDTVIGDFNGNLQVDDLTLDDSNTLIELEYAASDTGTYLNFSLPCAIIPILTDDEGTIAITEEVEPRCLILEPSSGVDQISFTDGTSTLNNLFYSVGKFEPIAFQQLKNIFYNELENRILDKAQILTFNVKLTETDIKNLNLANPVYIDFLGGWFYVNLVKEFTGSEQITECVIVQL